MPFAELQKKNGYNELMDINVVYHYDDPSISFYVFPYSNQSE